MFFYDNNKILKTKFPRDALQFYFNYGGAIFKEFKFSIDWYGNIDFKSISIENEWGFVWKYLFYFNSGWHGIKKSKLSIVFYVNIDFKSIGIEN